MKLLKWLSVTDRFAKCCLDAQNGVQLLFSNFFTAIGKAMKGLLLSLTRQVFFLIPLILILPLWLGVFGVLLAGPIADFIAFVVSVSLVRRQFKLLDAQAASARA